MAEQTGEKKAELFKLQKCSGCGANLIFDTFTNSLYCAHCNNRYPVRNIPFTQKTPFNPQNLVHEYISNEIYSVKCENCGASFTINSGTISNMCPFCSGSKIITTNNTVHYPEAIVPFSVKKEELTQLFALWTKKRKFVPKSFKKFSTIENAKPLYNPVWVFDAKTVTNYNGKVYYNITETVHYSNGKTGTRTKTEYKHVSGVRSDNFKNISIPAGDKINNTTFNKLEPFNIGNIKVFSPEYLAGFFASNYSVDLASSWQQATTQMDLTIKNNIVKDYRADGYSALKLSPTYSGTGYAYTLFPVWICTYIFNSKIYNIFINGTTGRITGKTPISKIKVFSFITFILLLIFILVVIFAGTN